MDDLIATHPFGTTITPKSLRERFLSAKTWEEKYRQLILLSRELPSLSEEEKQKTDEVKGCENRVWIGNQYLHDGTLHFFGDSEGRIVKGLMTILLIHIEKQTPDTILHLPLENLFFQLGLEKQLSDSRLNGIHSLISAINHQTQQALTS